MDKAQEAADIARERNEFRLVRIEREKEERAAKHAARAKGAKAAKEAGKAPAATTKQPANAAAIARAKLQKEGEVTPPKNIVKTSAATKAEIEAVDGRRKKAGLIEGAAPSIGEDKQAKIAAAIARAKAKKITLMGTANSSTTTKSSVVKDGKAAIDTDKQAKKESAISRAEAQKAAALKEQED